MLTNLIKFYEFQQGQTNYDLIKSYDLLKKQSCYKFFDLQNKKHSDELYVKLLTGFKSFLSHDLTSDYDKRLVNKLITKLNSHGDTNTFLNYLHYKKISDEAPVSRIIEVMHDFLDKDSINEISKAVKELSNLKLMSYSELPSGKKTSLSILTDKIGVKLPQELVKALFLVKNESGGGSGASKGPGETFLSLFIKDIFMTSKNEKGDLFISNDGSFKEKISKIGVEVKSTQSDAQSSGWLKSGMTSKKESDYQDTSSIVLGSVTDCKNIYECAKLFSIAHPTVAKWEKIFSKNMLKFLFKSINDVSKITFKKNKIKDGLTPSQKAFEVAKKNSKSTTTLSNFQEIWGEYENQNDTKYLFENISNPEVLKNFYLCFSFLYYKKNNFRSLILLNLGSATFAKINSLKDLLNLIKSKEIGIRVEKGHVGLGLNP